MIKIEFSVFVEEIPGTNCSSKVNKIYWERLIKFRAFAPFYEQRHQELLQFIGKRFQILLVNQVCRILNRRPSKTVHLSTYTYTKNSYAGSIFLYRRPYSHSGSWAPLVVFSKNIKKHNFSIFTADGGKVAVFRWGNLHFR